MAAKGKLPLVLVHIHLTAAGGVLADSEPLRDALVALVQTYADQWGVRVKRRRVSRARGAALFARYERRALLHTMIE